MKKYLSEEDAVNFGAIAFLTWVLASWITHVVVCLATSAWGFLIAGALLFPIACVHGTGIWFGWW